MTKGTFGEGLKREREMRGVSLDEISAATRIATRFLQAIENEQWDQLPGGVFNRGFVRAVARYLGLDEENTVAEYVLAVGDRPGVPGLDRQASGSNLRATLGPMDYRRSYHHRAARRRLVRRAAHYCMARGQARGSEHHNEHGAISRGAGNAGRFCCSRSFERFHGESGCNPQAAFWQGEFSAGKKRHIPGNFLRNAPGS